MTGLDGIGLLERLREIHPDTPMVMVTAIHDVGVAISAMRKGAYDYLLKPFEKEQLLVTVRRALDYRQLVQQNQVYRHNLEQLVSARTEMLRQAMADLERSYDITLEALGDALDLKDQETEGHSRRVTAYTIALARHCGVELAQTRIIARGAFLHDIGKMAIPDAILLKPGKLDPEEQAIMREHCARGYQILRKIPFLRKPRRSSTATRNITTATAIPRGLSGEEIPLGARIFAIADTVDAITSDRPYRSARSYGVARKEIEKYAGTQFDPNIVEVFLGLPDSPVGRSAGRDDPFPRASHPSPSPEPLKISRYDRVASENPQHGGTAMPLLDDKVVRQKLISMPLWSLEDGELVRRCYL